MGKEKGSDNKREKEKQRRRRVRRYLCLTDEHRGRLKIIVDRKAEKYQSSEKGNEGMTKIAHSKENKYESIPIMVKREKIRGAGRLKDTANDLAAHSLHKLKTKCVMERFGRGSLSY